MSKAGENSTRSVIAIELEICSRLENLQKSYEMAEDARLRARKARNQQRKFMNKEARRQEKAIYHIDLLIDFCDRHIEKAL